MNKRLPINALFVVLLGLGACNDNGTGEIETNEPVGLAEQVGISAVAEDVLFLVLGKMSLYDQSADGEISLRNHHFVAEIMPKAGRQILGGTLTSKVDPSQVLEFNPEGNAFLAHGARVLDPEELHELHPDGDYVFSYETQSGRMEGQSVSLAKRPAIAQMPTAAVVNLSQAGLAALPAEINPQTDLSIAWEPMPGNTRVASSDLDDLIFVLVFDCYGNNVAHSGRPYQGGPYLTYADSEYVVAADQLQSGLKYTVIVEQATADVTVYQGVPGIATYATLTFVDITTTGANTGETCP